MTAELGDERSFRRALREAASVAGKEEIKAAVEAAVRYANDRLREASPPDTASQDEWHVESIAESVETYWVNGEPEGKLEKGNAYVAEWTHPHADKLEVGVRPHEIEGDPLLYFKWPNAPEEVQARFRPQWESDDSFLEEPEVLFSEVQHPGLPGLGYIEAGFRRALNERFG